MCSSLKRGVAVPADRSTTTSTFVASLASESTYSKGWREPLGLSSVLLSTRTPSTNTWRSRSVVTPRHGSAQCSACRRWPSAGIV
jgi:hypothetical protein